MNVAEQIVIFLVSWWLVFLMALPIGAKSVEEAGEEVIPGTISSAPARPRIWLKMGITTLIALAILVLFRTAYKYNWVTVKDFYN
jgi:predicted secreted protein